MAILDLIKQSYETFGFIANETIDKMRNAARLEVGQSLVESSKRSILRATMENAKFSRKELEVLYKWFEVSHQCPHLKSSFPLCRKVIGKLFTGGRGARFREECSLKRNKNQQLMLRGSPCSSVISLHGTLGNIPNQLLYELSK